MTSGGVKAFEVVSDLLESDFGIERERIAPATQLVDDLDFDSIDVVDLAHRLEDALDIALPDEAFENVASIGDVVARVEACLAASGSREE